MHLPSLKHEYITCGHVKRFTFQQMQSPSARHQDQFAKIMPMLDFRDIMRMRWSAIRSRQDTADGDRKTIRSKIIHSLGKLCHGTTSTIGHRTKRKARHGLAGKVNFVLPPKS